MGKGKRKEMVFVWRMEGVSFKKNSFLCLEAGMIISDEHQTFKGPE